MMDLITHLPNIFEDILERQKPTPELDNINSSPDESVCCDELFGLLHQFSVTICRNWEIQG